MSDLIERLRQNPNYIHWLVIAEAADRIEELEAERKVAFGDGQMNAQIKLAGKIAVLEDEVKRLRKALMWIAVEAWDLTAAALHARDTLEDNDDIRRP